MTRLAAVVAWKEIRDHLRDSRSIVSSAGLSLLGPGVVFLVSLSRQAGGRERETILLGMLSIFALVSAFAGAIDIAMDTTAGERERRSLLPLLVNPVTAREIVVGKWIAVTTFAMAAVALNLCGVIAVLFAAVPAALATRWTQLVLWMALGLGPLALLGAAVSLLVAVRCRTTKEAHSALRLVTFLPMLVGMFLVFFPDWVGRFWFLLPIVGQQVLIGVREQPASLVQSGVLAAVTFGGAVAALVAAARILDRDDIVST